MRTLRHWITTLSSVFALVSSSPAQDAVGVAVERGGVAHVFDPDTHQITTSIPIPQARRIFDVVIAPDLSELYVGDVDQIIVIDLQANPPAVAGGVNPIPLTTTSVQDLALTEDGRFLLTASGGLGRPLSVVDVQARMEVTSLLIAPDHTPTAVDVAPGGSVIVADGFFDSSGAYVSNVRRYDLDGAGNLSDTGDMIPFTEVSAANNLLVPSYPQLPGFINRFLSRHTVYLSRHTVEGAEFSSIRNNGLTTVETLTQEFQTGIDMAFDSLRSIAYVRTIDTLFDSPPAPGNSTIDGYFFNPLTGRLGPRIVSVSLDRRAGTLLGADRLAIDPRGRKLFVSQLGREEGVRVYDSLTGELLDTLPAPGNVIGIAVRRARKHWPFH